MGPKLTKRRRNNVDKGRIDCPFTVAIIANQRSDRPSKKRKTQDGNNVHRQLTQVSPFRLEGKFISIQSMDITYTMEPQTRWQNMSRYHNFMCKLRRLY
jgi:hypothetical protein